MEGKQSVITTVLEQFKKDNGFIQMFKNNFDQYCKLFEQSIKQILSEQNVQQNADALNFAEITRLQNIYQEQKLIIEAEITLYEQLQEDIIEIQKMIQKETLPSKTNKLQNAEQSCKEEETSRKVELISLMEYLKQTLDPVIEKNLDSQV